MKQAHLSKKNTSTDKLIKAILLLGIIFIGYVFIKHDAQPENDYLYIDIQSKVIPDTITGVKEISEYLVGNYNSDEEKLRALYIWITHNIAYDVFLKLPASPSPEESANIAIENKKGVCQHYADLLQQLCKASGIECYTVFGYTKTSKGEISNLSHAWNVVHIDSNYFCIDATWDAGYIRNNMFNPYFNDKFLVSPALFIKDHMPFDPIWQCLNNPINNNDFYSDDYSKLELMSNFNYHDSIKVFEGLNEIDKLNATTRRMMKNGKLNNLIREQVTHNKFKLGQISFNAGIKKYNTYVDYTNHPDRLYKTQSDLTKMRRLLNSAGIEFYEAESIFQNLVSKDSIQKKQIMQLRIEVAEMISIYENTKSKLNYSINNSNSRI